MKLGDRVLHTQNCSWLKTDKLCKENGETLRNEVKKYIAERQINDKSIRAVLETHPDKKPMYAAAGGCGGHFKANKVPDTDCKTEWGPPLRIYDNDKQDPKLLCSWDEH